MFDKYEDYPNGISRYAILNAGMEQLSRILEIEIAEYRDVVGRYLECNAALDRLSNMRRLLSETLSNWDSENLPGEAMAIQASILIGSMLEGSMQIFLLCFEKDFSESNWKIWMDKKDEDFKAIRERIDNLLSELVAEGTLSYKQRANLRDTFKSELKARQEGKKIERIMLDELIRFFEKFDILQTGLKVDHDSGEEIESSELLIERMDNIREARNCIHIFSKYETPTLETVVSHMRDLCLILKDLLFRTRCIDDEAKRQAYLESLLEIPGGTYIELDDSNRVISIRHSEGGH